MPSSPAVAADLAAHRPRALIAVAVATLIVSLLAGVPSADAGQAAPEATDLQRVPLDLPGEQVIPGELIVTVRDDRAMRRLASSGWQALAGSGVTRAQRLADRVALVRAEEGRLSGVVARLRSDPSVIAVEPNVRREYLAAPTDISYPLQWAHQQTNAEAGWDVYTGQGGTAPLIAIIDSGVDATHPDLQGVVTFQGRSVGGTVIAGEPNNDPCGIGHGTAVAGSAAAQGGNDVGIAGILWQSRVIDIALTSPENGCPGGPADSDTIAAMNHVSQLAEPPHVLNLSLGASLTSCSSGYQAAVNQARAAGIVVVAAAGNDGTTQTSIPASCPGVISVAATDADGNRATYSQRNPQVDIAAPGGDLRSNQCPTDFDDLVSQYVITTGLRATDQPLGPGCGSYTDPNGHRLIGISGTSFSSPYVAGAVALMRQHAANLGQPLGVDQTEAILQATAQDAGQPGRDCEFGFGILDVGAAMAMVQSGERPSLQPSPPLGSGSCNGDDNPPPAEGAFARVFDAATNSTNPVTQAVAVSSFLPDGVAPYAVIARVDDFADALAGSAVGFGLGPLLFTSSDGPLDQRTEAELLRVLRFDNGSPTVYIMGGDAAVPPSVDQRLQQLGITPVRLAGAGREATAVAASEELEALKELVPFATRDHAFVAFGRNWPDAVAAGQMAAYFGIPILVTNTDSLHPDTEAELQRLEPSQVYVLGGTAVIGQGVIEDIRELGLPVQRLAGDGRVDTALAISEVYRDELIVDAQLGGPGPQPPAVALNMDNNFNDILSASLIGGQGRLYLPLAGDGTIITDPAVAQFCDFGDPLLVIGGRDRIPDDSARRTADVVAGIGC